MLVSPTSTPLCSHSHYSSLSVSVCVVRLRPDSALAIPASIVRLLRSHSAAHSLSSGFASLVCPDSPFSIRLQAYWSPAFQPLSPLLHPSVIPSPVALASSLILSLSSRKNDLHAEAEQNFAVTTVSELESVRRIA